MSKTLLDASIYIDTYKLAGRLYDLRFALPKRDRAVLGERMFDAVMAMLADFTMSYKLRGVDKVIHTDRFLSSMNTYVGMMKLKTMRRTTERFRDCVLDSFGRFLGWNPQKECFCLKEKYTLKRVLERKYKVRL